MIFYGQIFVPSQNSYIEILTPKVMGLRNGALGWWLAHEDRAFIKEAEESSFAHVLMGRHSEKAPMNLKWVCQHLDFQPLELQGMNTFVVYI
jgi:hypothetical protein